MHRIVSGWLMAATLICVALTPVVITSTHGPADAVAMAETIAHGHSHGDLDSSGGHDATDHEHQFSAILQPPPASAPPPGRNLRLIEAQAGWMHLTDGPLRPPRV